MFYQYSWLLQTMVPIKFWHSFYSYIIFIFSEKEPRIGGLEKGQLSNNNQCRSQTKRPTEAGGSC